MRSARQTKILEIIESQDIETQDELVAALKNGIEGFIPVESLPGIYRFLPERLTLRGEGESWSLGERVEIEVDSVDFGKRRTRFRLLKKLGDERGERDERAEE